MRKKKDTKWFFECFYKSNIINEDKNNVEIEEFFQRQEDRISCMSKKHQKEMKKIVKEMKNFFMKLYKELNNNKRVYEQNLKCLQQEIVFLEERIKEQNKQLESFINLVKRL